VVERRQHARLALEAGEPVGVADHALGQQLDRDLAAQPGVERAQHEPMPPSPSGSITS
jgi:hypothetical protein